MAVVFISPKQRQKMFFMGITAMFLLFLIIVFLGVFLSGPKEVPQVLVFNKPKVSIDMAIFDSAQFKELQPFIPMEIQFAYKATTKDKKAVMGFISSISEEKAIEVLKDKGLTVTEIKEAEIGRENPFTPYYILAKPKTTTTVK